MVLVRRGAEPGCHRGCGGRLLRRGTYTYDCAHLDSRADLDTHGGTYLDTCAYVDAGADLHAYARADLDARAYADRY